MLKTNKRYTIAPCQHHVEAKLYNTYKMNHTGHSLWGHILGHEECDPCIVALRGQCIQQQLLTRGPKHPFSQTSRFGLPNGSPNWLNQSWGQFCPATSGNNCLIIFSSISSFVPPHPLERYGVLILVRCMNAP